MKIGRLSRQQAIRLMALLLLVLFFVVFTTISLHRFWQYASWYYDFGIFYQGISAVARGKPPIIDHFVFQGKHILGDHFHPLIFIISPIIALIPRPEVLLVVQALFVTVSGYFVYLTAHKLLKSNLESLAILIIYLAFVGLHNALITEFHAITLLPLPLSIFLYALVSKKRWLFILSWLGVLLTKETTFIIPAYFGLYLAVKNKGLWRKLGLFVTLASSIYGVGIIKWVMPAFSGREYLYLSQASSDFSWYKLVEAKKLKTIGQTLLSYGLLPIFAPEILPPVVANWASRFISDGPRYDLGMHYNAEIAPTLILATTIGYKRVKYFLQKQFKPIVIKLGLVLIALFSLLLSLFVYHSPALLAFNRAFYQHTKNFVFLDRLLEQVPKEGTVMAQHNLAGKLADRKVYILRENYEKFKPDYIVIDARDGQEPNNFWGIKDFEKLVEKLANDPHYLVYYDQGEQKIYQRQ